MKNPINIDPPQDTINNLAALTVVVHNTQHLVQKLNLLKKESSPAKINYKFETLTVQFKSLSELPPIS